MPDLTKSDVQKFDLEKVNAEINERFDEVSRITDGVKSWTEIPADREGRDRLPKMMEEMNLLGVYRDELVDLDEKGQQFAALKEVFETPGKFIDPTPKKGNRGDFVTQFMGSDYGKKVKEGHRGGGAEFPLESVGLKATIGEDAAQTNVDTDFPVRVDRLAGTVDELFQTPTVASLIPVTTTTSDSIEIVTEDYTDAAAETDEGDAVPEATLDFDVVVEPVRKIGVGIKATSEVLGDVGLMRGLVQLRIRQDLARREDLQLIAGDGIAPNLEGILNRTGILNDDYSLAAGTDDFMEAIFRAANLVRAAFLTPTAGLMNVTSWESVRLQRESAGTGLYLFGPPSVAVEPRIWGMRFVINENLDDNLIATEVPVLLGDWASSALIARNPNVTVGVTDSDASDFLADVLTFKVSMREALLVHRVAGFATVTVVA